MPRLHIIRSTYIGHNSRLNIIGKRIATPLTNALLNAHDEYVRNEYTCYLLGYGNDGAREKNFDLNIYSFLK